MVENLDFNSKKVAAQISTAIETQLICHKHYGPWADHMVLENDVVPDWVREIADAEYSLNAVTIINNFVCSPPFEEFAEFEEDDDYVASLLVRYDIGAISWASFLELAGNYSDARGGRRACEYYYKLLNLLEDSVYDANVAHRQRSEVGNEFSSAYATTKALYLVFLEYFKLGRKV